MNTGRIEIYVHSDKTTQNKLAGMVKILCESDAAAKTDEFIDFAKKVAKYCVGFNVTNYLDLTDLFPQIEESRKNLQKLLKEDVRIEQIYIMRL